MTFYVTEGGSGMLDPVAMGTAIQADLAAVGIDAKIETYEWNTFLGKVNPGLEGKADMAEMAWMTNDPDTLPYLALRSQAWPEQGGFNSGYYANEKVDELLEKARTSTDQSRARRALSRDAGAGLRRRALGLHRQLEAERGDLRCAVQGFRLQPSFLLVLHEDHARAKSRACKDHLPAGGLFWHHSRGACSMMGEREICPMLTYIAHRLLLTIPVLFGISVLVFLVISLIPGRPGDGYPRLLSRRRRTWPSSTRTSASTSLCRCSISPGWAGSWRAISDAPILSTGR